VSLRRALVPVRLLAALALLALVVGGCSASEGTRKKSPAALPDTTLKAFGAGAPLDLSSVRGPAVVNLWASWCGPCRKELPFYQQFSEKYAGTVKVIGIDFQDTREDKARELISQTGVTYPLYRDPDGTMRARVLPQLILVDEDGSVAHEMYVEITSAAQLEKLVRTHLGVSG
jgi:thiol-disulfide isomerase/thioredoxin